MDRWEYLISKEYRLRHHIAEYFFDNVDHIIDVGAYKFTIGGAYPYNVIPIDPLQTMFESYHGTVAQWVSEYGDLLNNNFGVMALGLEIEGDEKEWDAFYGLIDGAKTAIIEFSKDHQPSVTQAGYILEQTSKDIKMEIDLTFPNIHSVGFKPHANRKLIVLERK